MEGLFQVQELQCGLLLQFFGVRKFVYLFYMINLVQLMSFRKAFPR